MADISTTVTRAVRAPVGRYRQMLADFWATPGAVVGAAVVGLFIVLAALGPWIAPHSPYDFTSTRFAPPSFAHLFGTDGFGRDVFSRVIYGARLSFLVAATATAFSLLMGIPIGLVSGYFGGWMDEVLMRVMDALLALPSLVLALLIVGSIGGGAPSVVVAIGVVYAPRIARVIRSGVLSLRTEDFVQAARARGESSRYILFAEILPNTLGPVVVEGSIRMGFAILLTTSLSYLGLGASPPQPDWGLMINEARLDMFHAPWVVLFPALAIATTIVGFNVLGDGIRDLFDPRRTWSDRRAEVA